MLGESEGVSGAGSSLAQVWPPWLSMTVRDGTLLSSGHACVFPVIFNSHRLGKTVTRDQSG